MSVYMDPLVEDEAAGTGEYRVLGALRKDILDRVSRDWEDPSNDVKMYRGKDGEFTTLRVTVRRFGEAETDIFNQPIGFQDPKDAQEDFFKWVFANH
jgi:hypothetical protein